MKKKMLTEVKMEIEPNGYIGRYCRTEEDRANEYETWAKDLEEFIRDHRSQDGCRINVIREESEICSICENDWEVDEKGSPMCCDEAVEEFEKENSGEMVKS